MGSTLLMSRSLDTATRVAGDGAGCAGVPPSPIAATGTNRARAAHHTARDSIRRVRFTRHRLPAHYSPVLADLPELLVFARIREILCSPFGDQDHVFHVKAVAGVVMVPGLNHHGHAFQN